MGFHNPVAEGARPSWRSTRLSLRSGCTRIPTSRVSKILRRVALAGYRGGKSALYVLVRQLRVPASSGGTLPCPDFNRAFAFPMHLGRHRRAKHGWMNAA